MPRLFRRKRRKRWFAGCEAGERVAALAAETGFCASRFTNGGRPIGRWARRGSTASAGRSRADARRSIRRRPTPALPPRVRPTNSPKAKARIAELERLVGTPTGRISIFFAKPCGHGTRNAAASGAPISSPSIEKMTGEGPQGETDDDRRRKSRICARSPGFRAPATIAGSNRSCRARRRQLARSDPASGARSAAARAIGASPGG